jgi:hypothetical protein
VWRLWEILRCCAFVFEHACTLPTHHGTNRPGFFADAVATSRQSNVSANIISAANSGTRKVLLE